MTENKNVPRIRFDGFNDAWEQRKLSNCCTITGGNAWKSSDYSSTGDYLVVTIANVQGQKYINDKVGNRISVVNPGKYLLKQEDMLVSLTGNVGRVSRMTDTPAVLNQRVGLIKPKTNEVSDEFLFQVLSNNAFESSMVARGQGAAQANISNNDVLSYELLVPKDVREQTNVARLFRYFDTTIDLHQRKLDLLKEIKKSMMQKIFDQTWRFEGFTDPWEERKLGDLGVITSASRVHKEEWTTNGVRFLRSSDIVSSFNGVDNTPAFISNKLYQTLIAKSGTPLKGDILITGGGSIGIPYIINDPYPVYFKDADSIWFKQSDSFNSRFLFYFLQSPGYRRHLSQVSHVGTIAHYTIEQVQATPIKIPVIKEQMVIENLLSELDDALALHQLKIDKLKEIKKWLMQNMFV